MFVQEHTHTRVRRNSKSEFTSPAQFEVCSLSRLLCVRTEDFIDGRDGFIRFSKLLRIYDHF